MRIVWDLGGVLLRWRPAVLLRQVLPRHAADEASAALWCTRFFGQGGEWAAFDRGDATVEDMAPRLARRTGLAEAEVRAVVQAVYDELQPLEGSVELLQRLAARGLRQHFLSNMPLPYAGHIERGFGFFRHFQGGLFSGRERLMKPETAFFRRAQERFGLRDGEPVLFIDDSEANVQAARAFGWQALHFRGEARQVGDWLMGKGWL